MRFESLERATRWIKLTKLWLPSEILSGGKNFTQIFILLNWALYPEFGHHFLPARNLMAILVKISKIFNEINKASQKPKFSWATEKCFSYPENMHFSWFKQKLCKFKKSNKIINTFVQGRSDRCFMAESGHWNEPSLNKEMLAYLMSKIFV